MNSDKSLIVVAGPTAIGKTDLAIQLARHFNTEIISADSRQFYREMSIGTAKPSPEQLTAVLHHFVDSHSVTEEFSVGDFEERGLALLDSLFTKRDVVILAGGSGLYINAICEGFDQLPKPGPGVREELNQRFSAFGISVLQDELSRVDPLYFSQVDRNNPQRLIRALEVWRSTGKPFSSFHKQEPKKRAFNIIYVGLTAPRELIYERINTRVDLMIAEGLVEEVKTLIRFRGFNALNTVGYSELFDYLDGEISLEEAIARIKQNTRRFAKRQLTWFRRNSNISWFAAADYPAILAHVTHRLSP